MFDTIENSRIECKIKLVDDFEETVIGFLNGKDSDILYLRKNNHGQVLDRP